MRIWKFIAVALVVVTVIAAGAFFYAKHAADEALALAVTQVRAELGPRGSFTFANSETSPLAGAAVLTTVVLRTGDGTLVTADILKVTRGQGERLGPVDARRLRVVQGDATVTAASASVRGLRLPPGTQAMNADLDPSLLAFEDANLTEVSMASRGKVINIAVMHADHYGLGQTSSAFLQGIDFPIADEADFDRMGLAEASVSGVDLAMLVSNVRNNTRAQPTQVSDGRLSVGGFFMMQDGREIFRLGSASIVGSASSGGNSQVRFDMSGIDVRPSDKGKDVLADLGYSALNFGISLDVAYDVAGGQLTVSRCELEMAGVGSANMALHLAHVPVEADDYKSPATFAAIQFVSGDVSFKDGGLVNHVLAAVAKRDDVSEPTARTDLVAALRKSAAAAPIVLLQQLYDGAARFVSRPGTIEMTLTPPVPLSVAALVQAADDPGDLSDKLEGEVHLLQ